MASYSAPFPPLCRLILLFLAFLIPDVLCKRSSADNQVCASSISNIYGDLTFAATSKAARGSALCQNPVGVISVYAATILYCDPDDLQASIDYYNSTCQRRKMALLPMSKFAADLTDEAISRMAVLDQTDDPPVNITEPILISRDWYTLSYRTQTTWAFEMWTHTTYGFSIYGFWGGILVIGMINRFLTYLQISRQARQTSNDPEGQDRRRRANGSSTSAASTAFRPLALSYAWFRKHLITPSMLPQHHQQKLLGCTFPTRLETFVIFSYWSMSLILCAVNYRAFEGNLYWPAIPAQVWRYISDRTGIAAVSNLPLIWMFAGRNNIFIWATGWQFSTFNLFHRHIARVVTLEAIVHGFGYTAAYYVAGYGDYYISDWHSAWFYMGVVAVICMSFIVFFSFSFFRQKFYEFFLLVHIILAVVVMVGLFYHLSIDDDEYKPYIWPLVAIWCFDRGVRLVRIVYCNIHVGRNRGKTLHGSTGRVSYCKESNIVRVDVVPAPRHLTPAPGQHYYLYQPFRLTGWENHPFTLASWSRSEAGELTLSFLIKPCDGWTRRLRDMCVRSASGTASTTMLLEGPYGGEDPLWMYDEVLMVAGGSGITAMTPYIQEHIARSSAAASGAAGEREKKKRKPTRTCGVTLVWVERSQKLIRDVAAAELSPALARPDFDAFFYSTSPTPSSASPSVLPSALPSASASSTDVVMDTDTAMAASKALGDGTDIGTDSDSGALPSKETHIVTSHQVSRAPVEIRQGRPDIASIVAKAAAAARESGSRLAIIVCGPGAMADAARDAARRAMGLYDNSVAYFEEAFGW